MTEFVKLCPKCRHPNPEYENICSQCQQFIGMEPAVPKPLLAEKSITPEETPSELPPSTQPPDNRASIPLLEPSSHTKRKESDHPAPEKTAAVLYLEIADSSQILSVYTGNIVGQAHSSSLAQVQIPATVNGVEYIHRQHCRFDLEAGNWYLLPLEQSQFQQSFTNPTRHNRNLVAPEKRQLIGNGDEVQMSGVKFIVRLI